jgi:hypothetical protein
MTHHKFWLVLFILLGGVAVAGDVLLGKISGSGEIRVAARQFREEAAYLEMPTKNLVPNIEHVYREWSTSQSPIQQSSAQFRKFRTDPNGLVVDTHGEDHHKVTILFLGGSTTECNEVAEELRFPTVVQRLLREAGLDVATANAGVRGHTTQDSINALLNRPGFRHADIIVMMENINDRLRLGIQGNYDARLGKASPTSARAVMGALSGFLEAAWDFITYRSNTVFLIRYWTDQNAAWREKTHLAEVNERSIDLYEDAVLQNREKFKENIELFVNIVHTKPAEAAREFVSKNFDRSGPWDWLNVDKHQVQKGDWLLTFTWTKGQARRLKWLYVDRVVPVRKLEHGAYEEDFPFQAFQAEEPIRYDAPPFRLGRKFARTLTKAIKKMGVKNAEKSNYATPPRALLDALAQMKV